MIIGEWWSNSTEEEAAYLMASAALGFCILANIIASHLGFTPSGWVFLFPLLLFVYGFAQFIEGTWKSAQKSMLVKIANSVLVVLGGGLIVSCSALEVNWALQVPSSAFPHTRAMVAVLCLPAVIVVALPFAGLFASPLLMFFSVSGLFPKTLKELFSKLPRNGSKAGDIVIGVRFVGVIILFSVSLTALSLLGPYSEWVGDTARWYAYNFETERYSHCRMLPGQQIAYISGEYVVRASKNGNDFNFEIGLCNSPLNQSSNAHD